MFKKLFVKIFVAIVFMTLLATACGTNAIESEPPEPAGSFDVPPYATESFVAEAAYYESPIEGSTDFYPEVGDEIVEEGFLTAMIPYRSLTIFADGDVRNSGQECRFNYEFDPVDLDLDARTTVVHVRATTLHQSFLQWCLKEIPNTAELYFVSVKANGDGFTVNYTPVEFTLEAIFRLDED